MTQPDQTREVIIDYTNYRGERRERRIYPMLFTFAEEHEYHPQQWIVKALDCEQQEYRDFALAKIHSWRKK